MDRNRSRHGRGSIETESRWFVPGALGENNQFRIRRAMEGTGSRYELRTNLPHNPHAAAGAGTFRQTKHEEVFHRAGANLYTCSIEALNADTGTLVWYYQPSPHDTHDWDAVETPVLLDGEFHGPPRKLLAQASRNGYFFLLDRTNGEHLLTARFIPTDWASDLNAKGQPIPKKEPQLDGSLVQAYEEGATNWMAPSFDPQTQLFYVNAQQGFTLYYLTLDRSGKPEGHQGGATSPLWSQARLVAIDYKTGNVRWTREEEEGAGHPGILTTAGQLLITGDVAGNLLVLDPEDGRTLWHVYAGGVLGSSPMTYELDGRQYIVTGVDSVLYAWALPVSSRSTLDAVVRQHLQNEVHH